MMALSLKPTLDIDNGLKAITYYLLLCRRHSFISCNHVLNRNAVTAYRLDRLTAYSRYIDGLKPIVVDGKGALSQ